MYLQIRLTRDNHSSRWGWSVFKYTNRRGNYELYHLPNRGNYAFIYSNEYEAFESASIWLKEGDHAKAQ